MKRIKYINVIDKVISKTMFSRLGSCYISIYKDNFNFTICNHNGKIIISGKAKSMGEAKKKAKMELINLGAIFYNEVRKKIII